jgi:hypothetical protein
MCSLAPSLLVHYGNKINIYDNANFIPMPGWVSCPAPPMEIIAPVYVSQTPCGPHVTGPVPQPVNPPGSYYVFSNPYAGPGVSVGTYTKSCTSCQ